MPIRYAVGLIVVIFGTAAHAQDESKAQCLFEIDVTAQERPEAEISSCILDPIVNCEEAADRLACFDAYAQNAESYYLAFRTDLPDDVPAETPDAHLYQTWVKDSDYFYKSAQGCTYLAEGLEAEPCRASYWMGGLIAFIEARRIGASVE